MNYGIIRSKGLWYRFPEKVVRPFSFRGRGSAGAAGVSETRARVSSAIPGGSALSGWPVERASAGG